MKKSLTILLIGVFVLSILLSGCGTQSKGSESTQSSVAQSTAGTTAAPTQAVQEKPVKIIYGANNEYKQDEYQRIKDYMEQKSGVKFETKILNSGEDFEAQTNIALASNEDIDVIDFMTGTGLYQDLIGRGALQKLNDPLQKYGPNLLKIFSADAWRSVTDKNGDIYAIPGQDPVVGTLCGIRKDWREKLGMGPITSLAELEKYLVAVRDGDLDGNEKKDTIPLTSSDGYGNVQCAFLPLFTDTIGIGNYLDANGNLVPVEMNPKFKDYLATMARWTKEGLLDKQLSTEKLPQINDLITNNRVGALAEWYSNQIRPSIPLKTKVPLAEYEYITPKTLSGAAYPLQVNSSNSPLASIVSYSKNTEYAMKLYDWQMASIENYNVPIVGIEGEDWKYVDKSQGIIERLNDKVDAILLNMSYTPFNFKQSNADEITKQYDIAKAWYLQYPNTVKSPDWFVTYNWKGTPVETSATDAQTLLTESIAKIILGETPVSEWDKIIAKYKSIYGDKYVELATQQYKAYKK